MLTLWKKSYDKPRQHIKKQKHYFATKACLVKLMVFPVVMYGCESWTIKKAKHQRIDAFWTVVLEKTLESPLYCEKIKPVNPKGNQSWILIWRTDVETETSILGHLMWRTDSLEKTLMLEKIEGRRTKDEMVGWHHRLNEHEFEQALGAGDGQGSLVCCSPWGHKESNMTEQLNWTESDQRNIWVVGKKEPKEREAETDRQVETQYVG